MSDERTQQSNWLHKELLLSHSFHPKQLGGIYGATSSEWLGAYGHRAKVMAVDYGKAPDTPLSDYRPETVDLELLWIGWTPSIRNNELAIIGRIRRRVGRVEEVLVGDGSLFPHATGTFTVRGQLFPGDHDPLSEVFGR